MGWMLILATAWVVLALALARLIGGGIRVADEREAVAHRPATGGSAHDADAWLAGLLVTPGR